MIGKKPQAAGKEGIRMEHFRSSRTSKAGSGAASKMTSCETCARCYYDEEYGGQVCDINMDEDEYMRFMTDSHYACPYYQNGDEYAVVRHQM